jgi:predicted protein tyrosine phosphatase
MPDNQDPTHAAREPAAAADPVPRLRRILFVCNMGRIRSRTAAELYASNPGLETRYAGVDRDADRRLSREDLFWADQIFVFEKRQRNIIHKRYPDIYAAKPIECLYVKDEYAYGDPELPFLLPRKLQRYLGAPLRGS